MSRVARIIFRLRWPLTAVWLTGLAIFWWWMLLPSIGGAAGLAGVMGFIPFFAWQGALYYVVSIDMVVLLLITLVYAVDRRSDLLVRVDAWKGKALASASLAAAVMSMGLLASLLDWAGLWAYVVCADPADLRTCRTGLALALFAILWSAWAIALGTAAPGGDRQRRNGRFAAWLGVGSIALLAQAGLVLHESIYLHGPAWLQSYGSYTGLVFGSWSLLWACGAGLARLHASPGYRRLALSGVADRSAEPPAPSLRGAMPTELLVLYRVRLLIFTTVALTLTFWVWMVVMDVFIREPIGGMTLKTLDIWWHVWMLPDHLIRGMLGVYPASRPMHWLMTGVGLGLFAWTQWVFIRPRRHWALGLGDRGRPTWGQCLACALPAAALTVGLAATWWEVRGGWYDLTHAAGNENLRKYDGMILQPTFWKSLPVLIGSFIFWAAVFRRRWRRGDGFFQRIQMLFWLFSLGGIELLVSGVLQADRYGFEGPYYNRGTYTAAGLAGTVMLWHAVPGVMLLYAGGRYSLMRLAGRTRGGLIASPVRGKGES